MSFESVNRWFFVRPNTAVPTAGQTLYNNVTDQYNILEGMIGAYVTPASGTSGNLVATTGAANHLIFRSRRNPANDRQPLIPKTLIDYTPVTLDCLTSTRLTAVKYANPKNNVILVGGTHATPGAVIPSSSAEFSWRRSFDGYRVDEMYGAHTTPTDTAVFTTPDFVQLGITATQAQRDYIIQHLVYKMNNIQAPEKPMSVAFCISSAGTGVGGLDVTTASTQAIGTTILIGYQLDGSAIRIVITKAIRESLVALNANLVAAGFPNATIQPYLIPGTNPLPAGVTVAGTAGATANVDFWAIMSLAHSLAMYDQSTRVRVRVRVGLGSGLTNVTYTTVTDSSEGQGQPQQFVNARVREQYYMNGYNILPGQELQVLYPDEFRQDATYDVFSIEYCNHNNGNVGNNNIKFFTLNIAVISFEDDTTPYFTGAVNPQKTYIQTLLNLFNTTNNIGNATLAI